MADLTRTLLGDPPPGRTPWADPTPPAPLPLRVSRHTAAPQPPALSSAQAEPCQSEGAAPADTLRPVAPICAKELTPRAPPTPDPMVEWMAPADLLIEGAYQRDLSEKSIRLIKTIVENWDWRRFKPPVVAWTERGFEIIDGQHTAIAAATHPNIDRIPVLVVEAAQVQDRAAAFIGHNRDRLTVSPMQLHHAAVTAGDPDAITINQVCERAGVRLVASAHGGFRWKAGDTIAIGILGGLIGRRGAKTARLILEPLVAAGCAPITAHEIKAAEMLFTDPDYRDQLEPLPEGGLELTNAIKALGDRATREARVFAAAQCVPFWKALGIIWFRTCRKRRRA